MRRFTSRYDFKIDSKGRVSIPSAFRMLLERDGPAAVYLMFNPRDGAIDGYSDQFMRDIEERIAALPHNDEDRDALEEMYFANSLETRIDSDGRIILSKELIKEAGIDSQVTFVGLGSRFQIWEPQAYKQKKESRIERAKNLMLSRAGTDQVAAS